ncbi:MAG: helix-turn-helix domain-containing protein [Clostridia bacterium]|nr:helix-turn-helix domain-containing protein [Clostridia bacterium]
MDFNADIFRDNIQSLVKSKGISVRRLALDTGITTATLSRYMTEKRVPDLQYVMRIATYFNVSLDWLLGISDDKYSILPEDARELAKLYEVASDSDRQIARAVLYKYKGR